MKARRELSEEVRRLIEKRRENKREEGGLLGVLLGAKDQKRNGLSDSQIADNIIGVIFAATDTTASVLTWLLKYLHDHPNLLQEVSVSNFIFFKFVICMLLDKFKFVICMLLDKFEVT